MSQRPWHTPPAVEVTEQPIGLLRSFGLSVLFLLLLGGIVLYRKLNP